MFDYVPKPLARKSSQYSSIGRLKDTEYQERFPNYQSYIPVQELLPPHLTGKMNQSETQQKREKMSRSQYFHQLVTDNEKNTGGQRIVGISEQRTAFQWPYNYPPQQQQKSSARKEIPTPVYQPYSVPRNIYEPLPVIQRTAINAYE